jgi:hypothetical protein
MTTPTLYRISWVTVEGNKGHGAWHEEKAHLERLVEDLNKTHHNKIYYTIETNIMEG